MAGPNVSDLYYNMTAEEGKHEQYVRLLAIHAGRLVREERSGTKPDRTYNRAYFAAIVDLANGLHSVGGVIQEQDGEVRKDIKRMKEAISADRDIRQKESAEDGL